MRTNFLISTLILISNLIFGQIPKNAVTLEDKEFNTYFLNKENIPVIKGKIVNLSTDEVKQTKIDCSIVVPFESLQKKMNYELNADGTFEIKLDYPFPYQQIWLSVGDLFYTGLYANKDLYIELDAKLLKSQKRAMFNATGVKYLGTDGALNAYMNNRILYERKRQLELSKAIQELRQKRLDYPIHIKKYDSLYAILHELDNEYIKQNPSEFSWIAINERQSEYYGNLCANHWGKQMPMEQYEKVKNHKVYLTSNDGMLFYQYFYFYLQMPIARSEPDVVAGTLKRINMLDSLFSPSKSDFLKIRFSNKDPNEQKKILETVLPSLKTDWCKIVIQDEYNKTVEKLASINKTLGESKSIISDHQLGQSIAELSFGATLYKVDSLNAKTLLSNLKNSFQNKALLIDFWATWCAPCLAEFPHSKKLRDDTKDLPLEFVYLCTSDGSDMEKWKTKIAEYKLSGIHIYVEKKIENELMEMFSGSGFPTYVLINTKGEYKPGVGRPSGMDKKELEKWIK